MPSYNFSSYRSNPSISGNWNTGGQVVGRGSHAGGITPVGVERNRLGGVTAPRAAPIQPSVIPAVAPPTPQVPYNPATTGWTSLPMGPPQTVPAFQNPANQGWNSLPMGPPQTTPGYVQPRSVPVTNMPNTSYPSYNPNSPAGMFQGALNASSRLGGQGGGQRQGGGFGR